MSDIDVYKKSTGSYEALQERRSDYTGARKAFLDLTSIYLKGKQSIVVADFCCGTGNNTKMIADRYSVSRATLIDINREFLQIAKAADIKATSVETIYSDILKVNLKPENDVVISMFAYHHVPDGDKKKFVDVVKDALKTNGILLLGEIYSPDKATTLAYYSHLLDSIPLDLKTPELQNFLKQTAESDDFEYKVSRVYTHKQLTDVGFKLLDEIKVWPKDETFNKDVGTFVEVWRL